MHEELERALVDYYNEYRPLFDNVPPYYSIPIPETRMVKERKQREYWDVVTFSSVKRRFEGVTKLSPAATDIFTSNKYKDKKRWVINVNPIYYNCPRDLKNDLFPLLHEMTHVKKRLLSKNNLSIDYEKFPEMVSKAGEYHAELNPDGSNPDDEDFVLFLCFLAEVILNDKNKKRKKQMPGVSELNHPDPIKYLVDKLYPHKIDAFLRVQNKRERWQNDK